MIYPDTSVLIAAATTEAFTDHAKRLLARARPGELLASAWTRTELASALGVKERSDKLDRAGRLRAAGVLKTMLRDAFIVLPIGDRHFELAAEMIERDAAPLRGPDALHLAAASLAGAVLWTNDRPMATAADALGVPVARLTEA